MITKSLLRKALTKRPLGLSSQMHLAPLSENNHREILPNAKVAAVMALINFNNPKKPTIILIERSSKYPKDRHAGQISLPGGKQEKVDKNLEITALRETMEEIGVSSTNIEVLAALTPLYIPVSNFNVFPFVGICSVIEFTPEYDEVESIIEWPISNLLDPDAILFKDINPRPGILLKNIPYFDCEGHVLWGATAMMLSELREMLK